MPSGVVILMPMTAFRWAILLLPLCVSVSSRADLQIAKGGTPNRIEPKVFVLGADWLGRTPNSKEANAPEFLESLYPGQSMVLAVMAVGPDRDTLLNGSTIRVTVSVPDHSNFERHGLKARATRHIKAEGADFTLGILNAVGISQKANADLEDAMARTSISVFYPGWTVPFVDKADDVRIAVAVSSNRSETILEPVIIKVRPTADWLGAPPPTMEELGKYMNRYHQNMAPGRLLALLQTADLGGGLNAPSVLGFFAFAFRERSEAREAAVAVFPSLPPRAQFAVAAVFRFGGQDISGILPQLVRNLPPKAIESLNAIVPLKDPRLSLEFKDPVSVSALRNLGTIMDECWAGWMATGDPSYLRALVGLLTGKSDFPAYQAWLKARGGVQGLNARVARGLAYPIAGWSIGSFERTDPLVSDWIYYWERDPAFPPLLRDELYALPGNPAFRRQ